MNNNLIYLKVTLFDLILIKKKYLGRMSANQPEWVKLGIGGLPFCPRGNAIFKYISSYKTQPRAHLNTYISNFKLINNYLKIEYNRTKCQL